MEHVEKRREDIWNPLEIDQKVRPFFWKWDIFRRLCGKAGSKARKGPKRAQPKHGKPSPWQLKLRVVLFMPCGGSSRQKCLGWEVCVCQRQRPTSMDGWLRAYRWGRGTTFRERLFYYPGELTCRCSSSYVTCFDSTAKNGSEKKKTIPAGLH